MKKVKIKLIILGGSAFTIDFDKIKKWSTDLFEIEENIDRISLPNSNHEENNRFYYMDSLLKKILKDMHKSDLTVAIIDHPLENNYYERSLGDNRYVLSLHETGNIILKHDFKIWQFIIQEFYYMSAVYYRTKGIIPAGDDTFTHHDIRKCLFDFNDDKNNIVNSLGDVSICSICESAFDLTFVPDKFVKNIKKELCRLKKGYFFRVRDFIKERPIISLIIAIVFAIVINLLSNILYDLIKYLIQKKC